MTAVEWLEKRLLGIVFLDTEYSTIEYEKRIDKAKEMEKKQQGYTEEEVLKLLINFSDDRTFLKKDIAVKWFEQFKKK
jgi:AmiR/NasT family two-component response regulator